MKQRDYADYLQDIIDAIDDIRAFTEGMSFEVFAADKKTVNAVIRSIEVVGESAKRVPGDLKDRNQAIPWEKMVNMRNKLIHEYFGVDLGIIWQTINEDIPPLRQMIADLKS